MARLVRQILLIQRLLRLLVLIQQPFSFPHQMRQLPLQLLPKLVLSQRFTVSTLITPAPLALPSLLPLHCHSHLFDLAEASA